MTLYDFVQLSQKEKANLVWEGQFLSTRQDREHVVVLYRIFDFFCEVYYDKKNKTVTTLKPFRTQTLLQRFFSYQLNWYKKNHEQRLSPVSIYTFPALTNSRSISEQSKKVVTPAFLRSSTVVLRFTVFYIRTIEANDIWKLLIRSTKSFYRFRLN